MRKIGIVTTSRADYSSVRPVLEAIQKESDVELLLFVTAMHLDPRFGLTIQEIKKDGFPIAETVDMLLAGDSPRATAKSIGMGTIGFADAFTNSKPDILLVFGDRFELLSVASAAMALRIPLAHVSGGDLTEGAIDNQIRYAISHFSHLHFVAMERHARRLIGCGEESWRVILTGEPALDQICHMQYLDQKVLEDQLNLELIAPVFLVTFHPETICDISVDRQVLSVLEALPDRSGTIIFTAPNIDPGCEVVLKYINDFVSDHTNAYLFESLGYLKYYSLMALADVMVGNSSSGIWESPSFKIPVVNVGNRQQGREQAWNVLNTDFDPREIHRAVKKAIEPKFRQMLANLVNPYGDGLAVNRIVKTLKTISIDHRLLKKRFQDNNNP